MAVALTRMEQFSRWVASESPTLVDKQVGESRLGYQTLLYNIDY